MDTDDATEQNMVSETGWVVLSWGFSGIFFLDF